jgi:hypothetical protein
LAVDTSTPSDTSVGTDTTVVEDTGSSTTDTGSSTDSSTTMETAADTAMMSCDFPFKMCGGKCINVQFDALNCGDCGKVCPTGAKGTPNCTSGSCVLTCESGFGNCDDLGTNGCEVNLSNTDAHCGGCFKACLTTETCVASKCECKSGSAKCGTSCVNLTADDANCGVCGKVCAGTETCKSSICECKTGLSRCSTACVDTNTDSTNCGACGTTCAAGSTCNAGKCCPTGQINCGGTCYDPTKDPAHCGGCTTTCSGGTPYCVSSACAATCGTGRTDCSGTCTDTATDSKNCGMCGKACLTTEVCSASACVAAGFPGSTLVNATEGLKINAWIGTPGQLWKLCYKKGTDAATPLAFHTNCDGKGASVTIAKLITATTTRIMGGYTGISWASTGSWKTDPAAFLFSITNDYKHTLVTATGASAVYHTSTYGPTWGSGHDFTINSTMNGGYCYFPYTFSCQPGLTTDQCRTGLCGSYNTWTVPELEVWIK